MLQKIFTKHNIYSWSILSCQIEDCYDTFNRGCQSSIINYLTSNFFLCEIRLISQLKSNGQNTKKAIIIVTSRIYCFRLSSKLIFFSHKPQMETNFRLNAKCLRKDEHLEGYNNLERWKVIHPSCFKKVMSTVAENKWEGLLFCGKQCFNNNKKGHKQIQRKGAMAN